MTRLAGAAFVLAALSLTLALAPGQPPAPTPIRIALTFDDLPNHGPLPPGMTRADVARSLIATLKAHRTPPVYGFINARQLETSPADAAVLRLWREAGFPLGNHTYSHMDLHTHTPDEFERDVAANEETLRTYMGESDWQWFRYPFLREGDTPGKYRAVRDLLARRGYRVAQVTVSFDDYAYNDPYARCLARNDREGLAWLERSYRERAVASLVRARDASRTLFGRDIGHVLLLHIGAFETVMLPHLLDILAQQGFAVATLEDVQKDPIYAEPPDMAGPWSGSFINQMEAARRLPRQPPSNVFATLNALCRQEAG
jgi:peptidoglycan/xylan/chitin deacetylase (PgdA/CDA1 family)